MVFIPKFCEQRGVAGIEDRKSTRLNSSHMSISYAVFCLKKKTTPLPTVNTTGYINHVTFLGTLNPYINKIPKHLLQDYLNIYNNYFKTPCMTDLTEANTTAYIDHAAFLRTSNLDTNKIPKQLIQGYLNIYNNYFKAPWMPDRTEANPNELNQDDARYFFF